MSFRIQPAAPARPNRCQLFGPGSRPAIFEKMAASAADVINLDLEDSVAPSDKDSARANIIQAIGDIDWGNKFLSVRINGLDTPYWYKDVVDLLENASERLDQIMIPKVGCAGDLYAVDALVTAVERAKGRTKKIAFEVIIESAAGIAHVEEIAAASPRIRGMVLGTNDLVKDLGARQTDDRLAVTTSLGLCLLAARAYGLVCVDGVYNKYQDTEMLRQMCEQGRDMGFDGKTLIHPAQIAIANQVFAPSAADLDLAARQIEAFAAAKAKGLGIAVLDGNIVENLHVESARRLLARQDAIAVIEAGAN